jgi:hypothetical protein
MPTTRHLAATALTTTALVLTAIAIAVTSGESSDAADSAANLVPTAPTTVVQPIEATTPENVIDATATSATVETLPATVDETAGDDTTATDETTEPEEPADLPEEQPIDEINEPDVGPDAGAVTQQGGVSDKPVHVPPSAPPVPAPSWSPVGLELVEDATPVIVFPELPPVPIPSLGQPAAPDSLSSNEFGCKSRCITSALLNRNHFSPDVEFTMETNVTTTSHVWVLPNGPYIVNGIPAFAGKAPVATSGGAVHSWATTLGSLQHDTTYRIVVGAVDQHGNPEYATTTFTTVGAPDNLVAAGSPCLFQCITEGNVIPVYSYNIVDLEVKANADVQIDFAVSTQEPGTIGGHPFLPNEVSIANLNSSAQSKRVRMGSLSADTTYHVVAKATDVEGNTAYAVGQFHTDQAPPPPPPAPAPTDVYISFERVHIHGDGDQSAVNKGEISLTWFVGESLNHQIYQGQRAEEKIDAGVSVVLPQNAGTWVAIPEGGSFPEIIVNADEDDANVGYCSSGIGIQTYPYFNEQCDTTVNVIKTNNNLSLGWLDLMKPCTDYGLTGWKATGLCTVMSSAHISDDYVDFDVLISFHVG